MFYIVKIPDDAPPSVIPYDDRVDFLRELAVAIEKFRVRRIESDGSYEDYLFAFEGQRILFSIDPKLSYQISLADTLEDTEKEFAITAPQEQLPAFDGGFAIPRLPPQNT